jgi:CheY-like chemotaxis protein
MQLGDLTPAQAENVGHIVEAGRHLRAVIDDVLDISKVESRAIALTLQPVRVATIVGSALALVQPLADAAGIRLINESKNSRLYAMADQHRLLQVLLNLATNAINYNVPGGEVRVKVGRQSRTVNISVVDSGLGIPPGSSQRLFAPFDRLGREGGEVEGTGLGLSLSKVLAEAMGGTITAAPNDGQGTTFTLTLEASPSSDRALGSSWALAGVEGKPQQVLFIDDSLASIALMEEVLRLRPHLGVLNAMQAGIGLELARHHQPDVIILDANLPDLTGKETLRRLANDPRTRGIPVIMAGAIAQPRDQTTPPKRRRLVYLTEPIQIAELLGAIDAVLGVSKE